MNTKFLVQSVYDEVEENDVIAPVIYEDEDDSDEDESDADSSMEVDTVEDGEEPILYSDISDAEEDGSD